ncbi:deoxynucleotidyltransferase terminal-interacting protein 2 [Halyomorpha halys]|uniref:deoxynucleotidyltransferase terminal-interacting protein 2 n=1 Tax=Halyomorpha halys TaxID=286706 RepID=UPI0006D51F4C|nr:deoxynucleotidyltransferase terminal-interacting protein 2 [Halyomorpha halys]
MKEKEYSLDDVYISLSDTQQFKGTKNPEDLMKNSVISSNGFLTRKKLPVEMYNPKKSVKIKNQKIRRKLPEEVRNDIKAIKMRAAFDPKRFYKRNLMKGRIENIQVGTVVDSPADFYNSRVPNKLRKKTLVDELLADAKFKKDVKRRYVEIIEKKKFKYKKEYKLQKKKQKSKSRE